MANIATTLDEQIAILRSRGMVINDESKAKEVLEDIGYYRLGFYWFPFEKTYPDKINRTHEFVDGTDFDDAVQLYYFDFKLRGILSYFLNRIEINFRTHLVYEASNLYKGNAHWFADSSIVDSQYIQSFESAVYTNGFKLNPAIKQHHRSHPEDRYAYAWKTIEYMTFGSVTNLYSALLDKQLKIKLANYYGIRHITVLENYLDAIRNLRNCCAHGNVLYDFKPYRYLRRGPAHIEDPRNLQNLNGAVSVTLYMLKRISLNRYNEMRGLLIELINHYSRNAKVAKIIREISGLNASTIQ